MPGPDNDLSNRQLRLLWALLVGFVVFCHWDWLVLGEPIKGADISTYYTPFFEEYLRQFAKGRFPLWTNTVFSGHPIVGDPKYFDAEDWQFPGGIQKKLHLHARRIVIPHPAGGTLDVTAPLPPHMQQSWNLLGFDTEAGADQSEQEEA